MILAVAFSSLAVSACKPKPVGPTVINRTDRTLSVEYETNGYKSGFEIGTEFQGPVLTAECLTKPPIITPTKFGKPLTRPLRLNLPWCVGTKEKPAVWIIEYADQPSSRP
jgi:hypothetical protein